MDDEECIYLSREERQVEIFSTTGSRLALVLYCCEPKTTRATHISPSTSVSLSSHNPQIRSSDGEATPVPEPTASAVPLDLLQLGCRTIYSPPTEHSRPRYIFSSPQSCSSPDSFASTSSLAILRQYLLHDALLAVAEEHNIVILRRYELSSLRCFARYHNYGFCCIA